MNSINQDGARKTKTALITGASSGIGAASARLLARNGYQVALSARRFERLQSLAEEINTAGGDALPVQADIARLEDIQHLVDTVQEHYGKINLLLNNAGFGRMDWLEKLDPIEDIQEQLQVDLISLILLTRAVLPGMIARRSGHIINIASIAGLVATPTYSVYAAAKFGVRGFSDALRREVAVHGIRVSAIYPGGVNTEFSNRAHIRRKTGVGTPRVLRLEADQVARTVLGVARHPRRSVVIPWPMLFGVWFASLFPGITDWIIERGFVRRERGAD